jgi:LacI family transcriptional regulator
MPAKSPRYSSLSTQVATTLREEIVRGVWIDWLPGERALAETLQVSRETLRTALAQLRHDGHLEPNHASGNRIIRTKRAPRRKSQEEAIVALLTPDPPELMRPYVSLWVNELKTLLMENGVLLRHYNGQKFFTHHPAKALVKLISRQSAGCWLLANSTKATQLWFSGRSTPCVIAGTCHLGIDLPQVDLDHYALCRHAAGVLLAAGHRRLALLSEHSGRAGDIQSEAGFLAGVRASPHPEASPLVLNHDHSPASICKSLSRLLEMPQTPTALLVSNGASYLTVTSTLAQRGLRVPQDISVLSRDDEPFLGFLIPKPTYYAASPHIFAKRIMKPLLQSLRGEPVVPRSTRILPSFTKGASLRTLSPKSVQPD